MIPVNWIALFSHSGKEIADLSEALGFRPKVIFTDNLDANKWDSRLITGHNVSIPFEGDFSVKGVRETIYKDLRDEKYDSKLLITLHGFMGIIPKDLCESRFIINGHPGLSHIYPDLIGKDPQEKVATNISRYPMIGSIVHKVSPEIDSGELFSMAGVLNPCHTREDVYNTLRDTSLLAWKCFFRGYINADIKSDPA